MTLNIFKVGGHLLFFQEYHHCRISNILGSISVQQNTGPDFGPNCLQGLLAEEISIKQFNMNLSLFLSVRNFKKFLLYKMICELGHKRDSESWGMNTAETLA